MALQSLFEDILNKQDNEISINPQDKNSNLPVIELNIPKSKSSTITTKQKFLLGHPLTHSTGEEVHTIYKFGDTKYVELAGQVKFSKDFKVCTVRLC